MPVRFIRTGISHISLSENSVFSQELETASTASTLSTMLKKRYLYIIHTFYNLSTFFYKLKKNMKPSTKCFIFYKISTLVEILKSYKLLIINIYPIL